MGDGKTKYAHHLMDTLKFDESDLEMNEQGLFSDAQRQRFAKRRNFYAVSTVGIMILVGLGLRSLPAIVEAGIGALICAAIPCIMLYLSFSTWYSAHSDVKDNHVACAKGIVTLHVSEIQGEDGTSYIYKLDAAGIEFKVSKAVFLAFKSGDPYCVYYAPVSNEILSAKKQVPEGEKPKPRGSLRPIHAGVYFTRDDLENNRQGRMSGRQVAALQQETGPAQFQLSPRGVIFVIALIVIFQWVGIVLIVIFSVIYLLIERIFHYFNKGYQQRLSADITDGNAQEVEGKVKLAVDPGYKVWIDGTCFDVTNDEFSFFANGEPYRIYYAPRTRKILSIERLN